MDQGRFPRHVEHGVRAGDGERRVRRERIEMPPGEFVAGRVHVGLERLPPVQGGMREDGHFRVRMKQVLRALVVVEAGHHQNEAIAQVNVVRADGGMEQLGHWKQHGNQQRLRRALRQRARSGLDAPRPDGFGKNVKTAHETSSYGAWQLAWSAGIGSA